MWWWDERGIERKKTKGFLGFSFNFWEYALAHLITHFTALLPWVGPKTIPLKNYSNCTTHDSFHNMKFIFLSISISLCLILTATILVAGGRVHSISKDSVLMARGPVPSSAASSCTYIGGDDRADHRPCLTTPTTPPWGWWWSCASAIAPALMYIYVHNVVWFWIR